MKEIDEILLKATGMDMQTLYSRYGHKVDWKDFLADVYDIADRIKKISLTISKRLSVIMILN